MFSDRWKSFLWFITMVLIFGVIPLYCSFNSEHYKCQIQEHKNETHLYEHKLHSAARTNCRNKLQISHLRSVVLQLKKKSLLSSNALTVLENTYDGISLESMKRMIANSKSRKGRSRSAYSSELKSFAMTLQFYNCKAYDYVRETFDIGLPEQSTLRTWFLKAECTPGISKFSIDLLQTRADEYWKKNNKPLLLALSLNEMSLKKEIVCEKHTQNVWGYVDFGADILFSNNQDVAKEALVIMVVGVNLSFKLPVGYFFVNGLSGEEKANVVKETLHYLNIPRIKILTTTCDGPNVNFKMMA